MAYEAPTVDVNQAFDQALNPDNAQPDPLANVAAPYQQAPQAAAVPAGKVVQVFSPEGEIGEIPHEQLQEAIESGYRPASKEEVDHHLKEQKFGTTSEQLKTGLEGAASAATFGASTAIERGLGAKSEDINARRETNPGVHMIGQMAGLLGSAAIPGVGAANLMERAGVAGAEALGLGAAKTFASKVGSAATQAAIENMVFQGGDEVSKMLASDPNQSVSTAMADVGLAGLIGGGFGGAIGAANPLWKATSGGKLGGTLKAIVDHVGGIEGQEANGLDNALASVGIEPTPVVKAAMSENPSIEHHFQVLMDSASGSGIEAQEALKNFHNDVADKLVNTLGRTSDEVHSLGPIDAYETGKSVQGALKEHLDAIVDPISEQFDKVKEQFKNTELPQLAKAELGDKISELASREGYLLSPSSPQAKLINRVLEEIPGLKTLEDVRKYGSVVSDNASNPDLWRVGGNLRKVLRQVEEDTLDKTLGKEAPELLAKHAEARAAYKRAMDTIDSLNDRLHVGRYSGPGSFIKALKEMAPEDVLRRLSPKNDAGIIGELTTKFPTVAKQLQNHYTDDLLRMASTKAGTNQMISTKSLFTAIDKMSPQMQSFVLSPEALQKLGAFKQILEAIPERVGKSGTPKGMSGMLPDMLGGATGIAASIMGHNPVTSTIMGYVSKAMGRDVPDAARLALLKFLGSAKPIESEGFKSMTDFIHATIKGENRIQSSTKAVFSAGLKVLPQTQMPSETDRKRLDKQVQALQQNPQGLFDVGGKTAHYMPDAGTAMAQTATQAVNYLNSVRPSTTKAAPLDAELPISDAAKDKYNRALDVAVQPLSVLNHVKAGTLQVGDIQALNAMYPGLYTKLKNQLTQQMTTALTKGNDIPGPTRLSLSLFLGQPLDSTMTPQAIMDAQPKPQMVSQQGESPGKPPSESSTKGLNKMPGMYQTPDQARSSRMNKA